MPYINTVFRKTSVPQLELALQHAKLKTVAGQSILGDGDIPAATEGAVILNDDLTIDTSIQNLFLHPPEQFQIELSSGHWELEYFIMLEKPNGSWQISMAGIPAINAENADATPVTRWSGINLTSSNPIYLDRYSKWGNTALNVLSDDSLTFLRLFGSYRMIVDWPVVVGPTIDTHGSHGVCTIFQSSYLRFKKFADLE